MGKHWHVEHFACAKCEKPFLGHKHYEQNGQAYCYFHYHQLFGSLCYHCNGVIEVKAYSFKLYSYRLFHRETFSQPLERLGALITLAVLHVTSFWGQKLNSLKLTWSQFAKSAMTSTQDISDWSSSNIMILKWRRRKGKNNLKNK